MTALRTSSFRPAQHTELRKPRLLDLFCGAGGAAMGYYRVGFDIVGVDIKPQPHYPFEFVQADALEILEHGPALGRMPRLPSQFDLIHASPPCQRYIRGGLQGKGHPDLLGLVREWLATSGTSWVIENVPGAPMRADVTLCGSMFGRPVRRHRWFESNIPLGNGMRCDHSSPIVGVYGNPHGKAGAWPGMLPGTPESWAKAMGIDWMTPRELSQAIPPDYTEFVGRQLIAAMERAA